MSRALSPVIGVVTLVSLTVLLSTTLLWTVSIDVAEPAPRPSLSLSADAATETVRLSHRHGDELDMTSVDVSVEIGGKALQYQPPVPFFAATGFESGPEGAFNVAGSTTLRAGETASFALATTNSPGIAVGDTVSVQLRVDGTLVYEGEVTAT